jgi:hypothetical protein
MGDEGPPDHDRFDLGPAARTNLRPIWQQPNTMTVQGAPDGEIDP